MAFDGFPHRCDEVEARLGRKIIQTVHSFSITHCKRKHTLLITAVIKGHDLGRVAPFADMIGFFRVS